MCIFQKFLLLSVIFSLLSFLTIGIINTLGHDSLCICLKSDPNCLVLDFLIWLSLGFHVSPSLLALQWYPVKIYSLQQCQIDPPIWVKQKCCPLFLVSGLNTNFQWHPGKLHKPSVHSYSLTRVLRRCWLIGRPGNYRMPRIPRLLATSPYNPTKAQGTAGASEECLYWEWGTSMKPLHLLKPGAHVSAQLLWPPP